jgi:predicted nucleotidyltransferase component of viral defense system
MFECFLDRLSQSKYRNKYILKGGMLIAAMVGLGNRTTMDLDATLRDQTLTESTIRTSISAICSTTADDGVTFALNTIDPIRSDDLYGGYRARLDASFDTISVPLSIDISTGDVITPGAITYIFHGMFDKEKKIELWAYNVETIIAEKVETILSRNIFNTRVRDFYDIVVLTSTQTYDAILLSKALNATAGHRGTTAKIADQEKLLTAISGNKELQGMRKKYQKQFDYAGDITWEQIMQCLTGLCNTISMSSRLLSQD